MSRPRRVGRWQGATTANLAAFLRGAQVPLVKSAMVPLSSPPLDRRLIRRMATMIGRFAERRTAAGALAAALSHALGCSVAFLTRDDDAWKPVVRHGESPDPEHLPSSSVLDAIVWRLPRSRNVFAVDAADTLPPRWTALRISGSGFESLLLIAVGMSAWPSVGWLERLAHDMAAAFEKVALREQLERKTQLLRRLRKFSRRLSRALSEADLHQYVVDGFAEAAGAGMATLALYRPHEESLSIVATHGYPSVLVEHIRIPPGAGVIGGAYASREPLVVQDAATLPERTRARTRYRTQSFLAIPLVAGNDAVGVVSVTDRVAGPPFGRADLDALRVFAAPAALALARESTLRRAREVEQAAAIDPLTELFNRRYFHGRLEEEIGRAQRHGSHLSLLMLDLDRFKMVNDSFGHQAGDAALRDIARLLHRSVRIFDVCARLGGDEFAILMPGSGAQAAVRHSERIRQRLEFYAPESLPASSAWRLTTSIGIATLTSGESPDALIARGDRALYQAKAAGGNRLAVASL